ncbi:hypothetical protein ACSSV8_003140 [Roseovarius sp. MBR-79]|jgi:hypothetical protein
MRSAVTWLMANTRDAGSELLGNGLRFHDLPGREIGHPDVPNSTLGLQLAQCFESFKQRSLRIPSVQVQDIDNIQPKTRLAFVELSADILAAAAPSIAGFCRYYQRVAVMFDEAAQQFLGLTACIRMGCIEEVDTGASASIEHGAACSGICGPAKLHASKTQGRRVLAIECL